MSFQYNRLILSTCVSVMTLAFCMPVLPAYAGFEWTPPENASGQQAMPEVVPPGSALPLPPAEVEEQILQAPPMMPEAPAKAEAPVMKTKVLDGGAQANQIPPKQAPVMPPPPQTITRKNIVPTPIPQEQVAAPKQQNITPPPPITAQVPQAPKGLAIDPYPKENAQQKSAETPVVLPSNPNEKMADVARQQTKQTAPTPAPASQSQEPIKWNEGVNFTVVEGFGTDIPLALALSQIVPPEYAYSFGEGVNPGQRVSWTGGKPWNEVLSDVLAPLKVISEIKGRKLVLKSLTTQAALETQKAPDTDAAPKKKQLN